MILETFFLKNKKKIPLLLNSHGSGNEGGKNGPDIPWHCSAAVSRAADDRGEATAEAANSNPKERAKRIILE
jgi:hypothetical protein